MTKYMLTKIVYPAIGLPLDVQITVEVPELTEKIKELVQKGILIEID